MASLEVGVSASASEIGDWKSKAYKYYNDKQYREAMTWFRKAADAGDAGAQYFMGVMYFCGLDVAKDHKEAVKWYKQSALGGDMHGQYSFGEMRENGWGIEKNMAEAKTMVSEIGWIKDMVWGYRETKGIVGDGYKFYFRPRRTRNTRKWRMSITIKRITRRH